MEHEEAETLIMTRSYATVCAEVMAALRRLDDKETRHQWMDAWLCLVLRHAGYEDMVEIYESVHKYYI